MKLGEEASLVGARSGGERCEVLDFLGASAGRRISGRRLGRHAVLLVDLGSRFSHNSSANPSGTLIIESRGRQRRSGSCESVQCSEGACESSPSPRGFAQGQDDIQFGRGRNRQRAVLTNSEIDQASEEDQRAIQAAITSAFLDSIPSSGWVVTDPREGVGSERRQFRLHTLRTRLVESHMPAPGLAR